MQARYYDPVIGRFLSHDPEGFMSQDLNPMYFNRYKYTANNPMNAIDSDGRLVCDVDSRCRSIHNSASDARAKLKVETEKLNSLSGALSIGDNLTTQQFSTKMRFEKKFGSGSATVENLNSVSGILTSIHDQIGAEGEGSTVSFSDESTNSYMSADINGDSITVHTKNYRPTDISTNATALAHEVGHNIGLVDQDLPPGTPAHIARNRRDGDDNGNIIRKAYGHSGADYLGANYPNLAKVNNDNYVCLAFGNC